MKEYDVEVCRIGYGFAKLRITAGNIEEAKQKAKDIAWGHCFRETNSEYQVGEVVETNTSSPVQETIDLPDLDHPCFH